MVIGVNCEAQPMAGIASGRSILSSSGCSTVGVRSSLSKTSPNTTVRRISFAFRTPMLVGACRLPLSLRASAGGPNHTDSPSSPSTSTADSSTSEDDWNYILKLTVGSILGAALIKYGSVLLPDITRPNIVQALLMISTPVVVALYLLVKESSKE